jgi:hypothetical protein
MTSSATRPPCPTCWAVQLVPAGAITSDGTLRRRLLELVRLGHDGILLDVSGCGAVPLGELHLLGELISWFEGAPVCIRALAPEPCQRDALREAGVLARIPVVQQLQELRPPPEASSDRAEGEEHALFITHALSRPHGTELEQAALADLAEDVVIALDGSGAVLEGYDVVDDTATFYFYGRDVTRTWSRLRAWFDAAQLPSAISRPVGVELRFGGPGDVHVHLAGTRAEVCL